MEEEKCGPNWTKEAQLKVIRPRITLDLKKEDHQRIFKLLQTAGSKTTHEIILSALSYAAQHVVLPTQLDWSNWLCEIQNEDKAKKA